MITTIRKAAGFAAGRETGVWLSCLMIVQEMVRE